MSNEDIKKIIQEVFDKLGLETTSITEEVLDGTDGARIFAVQTPEAAKIIGRDGEGFQALNYVISKVVQSKDPEVKRVTVDVNGYYKESLEKIKQKARFAADRARSYKVDIEMEPMNSFERLIVHSMFPEGGDIKTHSTGVGSQRRVVLTYTGD